MPTTTPDPAESDLLTTAHEAPGAEVGRRIRRAREAKGLSQGALGEAIGYKASMVSAFENGTRRLRVEDLAKLCVALDKPPEYFLRTQVIRESNREQVGLTLRAQLADLHHRPLTEAITAFLDEVDEGPLPESRVPDLHYLKPHGAARELLDRCGISSPPVDVSKVATDVGVPLVEWQFPDPLSALIVEVGESDYVIAVNRKHGHSRQRFSIAHELGHAVLRHRAGYYLEFFNAEVGEPPNFSYFDEREANTFAAALLMDERWLREDWATGSRNVAQLARHYEVSQEAMSFRLMNLGLA